jgi:HD-like signal output (HDOD) protein
MGNRGAYAGSPSASDQLELVALAPGYRPRGDAAQSGRGGEYLLSELAAVISKDPAIAAKLLRMANSSQMGRPGQVADIGDAVMVLGTRSVNLLALSFSLTSANDSRSDFFDYTRFWTRSA